MSGGVDSAVTLLRARAERGRRHAAALGRPARSRRRARVLLARGRHRRPRDLSRARAAPCHARPARGVPALRRDAVRRRLRGGADSEPVQALQRRLPLPRARRLCATRRRGRLWTGHYARVAERHGMRLVARAATRPRTSPTCSPPRSRLLARVAFPLGDQTKDDIRAEADAAGLAARTTRESQEACFLAGGDYRAFLERQAVRRTSRDRSWTRTVPSSGATTASGASRRASVAGSVSAARAALRDPHRGSTATLIVGPRALACVPSSSRGRLYIAVDRAEVKVRLPRPQCRPPSRRAERLLLGFDEPVEAVARGQVAALYVDDAVVGAGVITGTSG